MSRMRLAGAFYSSSSVSLPTAHPKTSFDETDKIPAVPSYKREITEMKQEQFPEVHRLPVVAARLEILNFWESSGACRRGSGHYRVSSWAKI